MREVLQLALASLREHPRRLLLTSLATIAAATLVVWVVSGYDALLKSHDEYAELSLGTYPLAIAPIDTSDPPPVPAQVASELEQDPDVAAVDLMWLLKTQITPATERNNSAPSSLPAGTKKRPQIQSRYGGGPSATVPDIVLLATDSENAPFPMKSGEWLNSETMLQAVIREDLAERMDLSVGQQVYVGDDSTGTTLTVAGIITVPVIRTAGGESMTPLRTPGSGQLFVTGQTAEQLAGRSAEISFLGISLNDGTDVNRFRFGWAPRLSQFSTPVQFQRAIDIEEALDESAAAENVRIQAFATTGISLVVASLVILCTLSMGVSERIRQYAVLRAVFMTRSQIALLIGLEGFFLGAIGFAGGVLSGGILLWLTVTPVAEGLRYQGVLGVNCLALAACTTFGAALLASLIPAWRATRVRPVDAMSLSNQTSNTRQWTWPLLPIGIAFIAINPVLTFVFPPGFGPQVFVSMAVGFLTMAVGFTLITPALVSLVDQQLGPLLSRLLHIDPKLLDSQLSSRTWRTSGAAISMAVGMSLFVAVHVWGMTMLDAFIPGSWAPDALIAFHPYGLPPEKAEQVRLIDGVDAKRCEPIVVEQPRLLNDLTGSAERASVTRQDNVVIVGIDLQSAFASESPLFTFNWNAAQRQQLQDGLNRDRACLVPDHFLEETGLQIGDSFQLVPPENPGTPVEYVIAGALHLPGWHWQTKQTGFRSRTHRAAAIVFADYDAVAEDFSLPTASYMWHSYDSPSADPRQIEKEASVLYTGVLNEPVVSGRMGGDKPAVQIMPVEGIRQQTRDAAAGWIWMLSQIPLISAAIACIGMLNMMLVSIRSRSWELGVIRAIGITRGSIVRAILAEGILIGFVACVISLGFGILAGWCGSGFAKYISFFGGLSPALIIPWAEILLGMALFLAVVTFAMLWPALKIGRTSPHLLMQQGRASF